MDNILQYLVLVGMLVQFIGVATYIRNMITGKTRPNRITWLMWSIAPLIATVAALSQGPSWSVIPVFMSGFGPLMVFTTSLLVKNAYWELKRLDYVCGGFSLLALILWAITNEPNIAIVFAIISDGLAAAPTIIKAWRHPETETVTAYMAGTFSATTSFFAIKNPVFSELAFPVYLICVNATLIYSIERLKLRKIFQGKI